MIDTIKALLVAVFFGWASNLIRLCIYIQPVTAKYAMGELKKALASLEVI